MKTLILIISLWATVFQSCAQTLPDTAFEKNEIKLNTFYLFGGYPEVSYERMLGNRSAIGLTIGLLIDTERQGYVNDLITFDYALFPYYRSYFGKIRGAGFFLEGNGIVFSRTSKIDKQKELGAGLGIGMGYKFPIKKNWSLEFVVGGGYNLLQEPCINSSFCFPDMYPRLGLTIGKRF